MAALAAPRRPTSRRSGPIVGSPSMIHRERSRARSSEQSGATGSRGIGSGTEADGASIHTGHLAVICDCITHLHLARRARAGDDAKANGTDEQKRSNSKAAQRVAGAGEWASGVVRAPRLACAQQAARRQEQRHRLRALLRALPRMPKPWCRCAVAPAVWWLQACRLQHSLAKHPGDPTLQRWRVPAAARRWRRAAQRGPVAEAWAQQCPR